MQPSPHRDLQVLYLTTTGRVTGLPREIEIWFVASDDRLYILAEHFHKTHWVRNIERNPHVRIRLGGRECGATARILDPARDRKSWQHARRLSEEKYGWGDGLPVEITPDQEL